MKRKLIQLIHFAISPPALLLLATLSGNVAIAQQTAPPLYPKLEAYAQPQSNANWIDFREGTTLNPATIFTDLKDAFRLSSDDNMMLVKTETDNIGFNNYRYQQYYKNLKVVFGEYFVHQQPDGFVKSANGRLINGLNLNNNAAITEQQALTNALQFMNAKKYLWQNPDMESELKRQEKNANATYYPKGELVFAPDNYDATFLASDYKLAWTFKIYTDDKDVTAKSVFVDALTGKIILHNDIAMNCNGGTGGSAFNGSVSFNTTLSGNYLSHNDCQATDIYVYNCNGGAALNLLYSDADNAWTLTSQQSAVQAQYGALMTYNYYIGQHSRASWDNASGDLIAYNNAYAGQNNACWGCTGNQAIFYAGNTSAATDDWNTDDIMGHEFTHGVTQASAGLVYNKESGGLNESFSDIFGEMVESWAEGNCDYLCGADRGAIRSFIDPNSYGQPDTYLGTDWYSTTSCTPSSGNDNCGVHTNSGVQNHWFYLLSEGGSGTTDFGVPFNVTGITRFKARLIAYRALTVYMNSTSQYIDARAATLHAAWDLYGGCSAEIIAVGDAWHAVGVESQSAQFTKNICGTYPASGTFLQAISIITAANGCTTSITPSATPVYITARDRVVLYPGFRAYDGSRFTAYLEPCSSTMWKGADQVVMSDAEKGIKPDAQTQTTAASTVSADNISIAPNPFNNEVSLSFALNADANVKIQLFDALGNLITTWDNLNSLSKGFHNLNYKTDKLTSGIYFVNINIDGQNNMKKVVKMN